MVRVLEGVRVVEVAEYVMIPAAAAVLADWGAAVVKIEHAERGDAVRSLTSWSVAPGINGFTYIWEAFNRGKRSVGLDLTKPEAREILYELVRNADVFLTNLLPSTRVKLGIDVDHIQAINPRCLYARGSAYGPKGPDAGRGGFDGSVYWQRTGAGLSAMPDPHGDLIMLPAPAFGDSQAGMAIAGGIAAALYHRERTGEAKVIDCSLLSAGMWAMQAALIGANLKGVEMIKNADRTAAASPLSNVYRTRDNRFIALAMLQGDRYWENLCRLLGCVALGQDSRFSTVAARGVHNGECIAALDAVFAEHPLAHWTELLAQQDGQWAVVEPVTALNSDPQALANRFVQQVDYGSGRKINLVTSPIQFDEEAPELSPAPSLGADTEMVLHEELGLPWERILELKEMGAIN